MARPTKYGVLFAAFLALGGCVAVNSPPAIPAPVAETTPLPPLTDRAMVWRPGAWDWTGAGYEWRPGRYEELAGHGTVWQPGYWEQTPSGWRWLPAHWL